MSPVRQHMFAVDSTAYLSPTQEISNHGDRNEDRPDSAGSRDSDASDQSPSSARTALRRKHLVCRCRQVLQSVALFVQIEQVRAHHACRQRVTKIRMGEQDRKKTLGVEAALERRLPFSDGWFSLLYMNTCPGPSSPCTGAYLP